MKIRKEAYYSESYMEIVTAYERRERFIQEDELRLMRSMSICRCSDRNGIITNVCKALKIAASSCSWREKDPFNASKDPFNTLSCVFIVTRFEVTSVANFVSLSSWRVK